jgi:peroxiredoxin Q/BCP
VIEAGERAPDFTLPAIRTDGSQFDFHLAGAAKERRLLLVFYQDDGMPICTSELKAFAQEFETLAKAQISVAAINTNGIGSHQKFQERDAYPFPLISDFHGEAVKAYGFWDPDERKSRRGVVVIAPGGSVAFVVPHFNPGNIGAFEDVFRALGLV